jgi:hypothetical protein
MARHPSAIALLVLSVTACVRATPHRPTPSTATRARAHAAVTADDYFALLSTIRPNDVESLRAVDFGTLRRAYFEALQANRLTALDRDIEARLGAALGEAKWDEVVKLADAILKSYFTRIRAHMLKAYAQDKLGQDPHFHATVAHGLLDSILATGDGNSEATAYHVLFVEEEYDVLMHRRLRRDRQDLIAVNGRHFDLLSARNADGRTVHVWFDVNEFYGRW